MAHNKYNEHLQVHVSITSNLRVTIVSAEGSKLEAASTSFN